MLQQAFRAWRGNSWDRCGKCQKHSDVVALLQTPTIEIESAHEPTAAQVTIKSFHIFNTSIATAFLAFNMVDCWRCLVYKSKWKFTCCLFLKMRFNRVNNRWTARQSQFPQWIWQLPLRYRIGILFARRTNSINTPKESKKLWTQLISIDSQQTHQKHIKQGARYFDVDRISASLHLLFFASLFFFTVTVATVTVTEEVTV